MQKYFQQSATVFLETSWIPLANAVTGSAEIVLHKAAIPLYKTSIVHACKQQSSTMRLNSFMIQSTMQEAGANQLLLLLHKSHSELIRSDSFAKSISFDKKLEAWFHLFTKHASNFWQKQCTTFDNRLYTQFPTFATTDSPNIFISLSNQQIKTYSHTCHSICHMILIVHCWQAWHALIINLTKSKKMIIETYFLQLYSSDVHSQLMHAMRRNVKWVTFATNHSEHVKMQVRHASINICAAVTGCSLCNNSEFVNNRKHNEHIVWKTFHRHQHDWTQQDQLHACILISNNHVHH